MKRLVGYSIMIVGLTCSPAQSQIRQGTIEVVYFSQDKIIIAADSRSINVGRHTQPIDSFCKIATLDGQIIFAASNASGYIQNTLKFDPVGSWSVYDDAKMVFGQLALDFHSHVPVALFADAWAKKEVSRFSVLNAFHHDAIASVVGNGILVTSFIGGVDPHGQLVLFKAQVTFGGSPKQVVGYRIAPEACNTPFGPFCAGGEAEVLLDYMNLASQRSKLERLSWENGKAFSKSFRSDDLDIVKAIRLADLTIAFYSGPGAVGSPIDAVELRKDGTIRWFARKENCQ
jgi:hypothetical protein